MQDRPKKFADLLKNNLEKFQENAQSVILKSLTPKAAQTLQNKVNKLISDINTNIDNYKKNTARKSNASKNIPGDIHSDAMALDIFIRQSNKNIIDFTQDIGKLNKDVTDNIIENIDHFSRQMLTAYRDYKARIVVTKSNIGSDAAGIEFINHFFNVFDSINLYASISAKNIALIKPIEEQIIVKEKERLKLKNEILPDILKLNLLEEEIKSLKNKVTLLQKPQEDQLIILIKNYFTLNSYANLYIENFKKNHPNQKFNRDDIINLFKTTRLFAGTHKNNETKKYESHVSIDNSIYYGILTTLSDSVVFTANMMPVDNNIMQDIADLKDGIAMFSALVAPTDKDLKNHPDIPSALYALNIESLKEHEKHTLLKYFNELNDIASIRQIIEIIKSLPTSYNMLGSKSHDKDIQKLLQNINEIESDNKLNPLQKHDSIIDLLYNCIKEPSSYFKSIFTKGSFDIEELVDKLNSNIDDNHFPRLLSIILVMTLTSRYKISKTQPTQLHENLMYHLGNLDSPSQDAYESLYKSSDSKQYSPK